MTSSTHFKSGSTIVLDTAGIDAIERAAAREGGRFIKVGILAGKAARQAGNDTYSADEKTGVRRKPVRGQAGDLNNPTLGLIHEKGSISGRIPRRSFLFVPLVTKLPEKLAEVGAAVWASILATFGVDTALEHVAVTAENVVQEAFETSGYGAWPANAPATIREKGSSRPLIDSAQLRKSVTSKVERGN